MSSVCNPETEEQFGDPARKSKAPSNHAPRYNVVLWDDDHHTVGYVMQMLQEILKLPEAKAFEMAELVHDEGKAIVFTGVKEPAEMRQEQITSYGKDHAIAECKGSMTATLERC
jgi:ATP-dependent Clp protease adaptor protein ClpS